MQIKKAILSAFVLVCSFTGVHSQKLDLGILLGGSYYYGDVVNEIEISTIRPAASGFIRYTLGRRLALRGNVVYARITGDDKLSSSSFQNKRDWRFFTDILEGSLVAEWNIIEDRNTGRKIWRPFVPYVYAGVGVFYYNPKTEYNGEVIGLRPLMLSGINYSQYALCFPLGIGYRYYLSKNLLFGLDFGIRYTSTSYLDDIGGSDRYIDESLMKDANLGSVLLGRTYTPGSPRGKMSYSKFDINDLYYVGGISLAYRFDKVIGSARPSYQGKSIRCPRFY